MKMKKTNILTGVVQNHYVADAQYNRSKNLCQVEQLANSGADLIVLSELHDSLYFCQTENVANFDLAHEVNEDNESIAEYARLARFLHVVIITSFFEKRAPGLYHNTAVVIDSDGTIAGKYRKMHIPDDPAYYEKFYFAPGDLGFTPVDTSLGRLGVCVCWDQWYPEAARIMALQGADMLIYPTAIGWESTDPLDEKKRQRDAWITIQRAHAVANGLPVIVANRVGYEPDPSGATNGITFWGSSFVAGPQGEILAQLSDNTEDTILTSVDMNRCEQVRRWWPFLRDRRIDAYKPILQRYIDNK